MRLEPSPNSQSHDMAAYSTTWEWPCTRSVSARSAPAQLCVCEIATMGQSIRPRSAVQVAAYAAALVAPSVLTLALVGVSFNNPRDYAFLYLAIVAVLGVASGIGPALATPRTATI